MADPSFLDQYVINPVQNAFTSLTKGSDLSGLPYSAQEAALARRQKMAELLMQQGQQQPEVLTYKGIAAQPSVAGGLGKALSQFMGAYMGGKAEEDLATAKAKEAKDVGDIFAGLADRPDVKTEGYYLPTEQPSKTMPIGMPRGASSFMPEGEATNMGTYVPGTVTPGQHLSRSEKTNRIMAAMAAHPSMAALAPMYVQNMQNEVADTQYATSQSRMDRQEQRQTKLDAETKANNEWDRKWKVQAHQDTERDRELSREDMRLRHQEIDAAKPKFTLDQGNSASFAEKMFAANKMMSDPAVTASGLSKTQAFLSAVPVVGNMVVSDDRQALDWAKRTFIASQLRRESGASISPTEFVTGDKMYFPQTGDSQKQIDAKAALRQTTLSGMARGAGPNFALHSVAINPATKQTIDVYSHDGGITWDPKE